MKPFSLLSILLVAIIALAACAPQPTPVPTPEPTAIPEPQLSDIVDTAVADGRFTTLTAALGAAELVETLKGEGPFTVFAPTDDAFAKLPEGTVATLLLPENLEQLKSILLYHVVSGKVMASDVVALTSADTVGGQAITIKVEDGKVFLNDTVEVIITDVEASNGVIHVIDSVLLPPAKLSDIVDTAVADGRFTTLAAALGAANLVNTLKGEGPFTVFAPTDDAFAKLPAGTVESLLLPENLEQLKSILLYHVVSGLVMASDVVTLTSADTVLGDAITIKVEDGKVFLNDTVEVIITDVEASNGIIHVIDSVLLPPAKLSDIVDTAVTDGRFTTLAAALGAADLVETLKGEGPFTVFAPTDDAFAKLPAGTVESLLLPENLEQLQSILLYHVVSGKVMASDVVTLTSADTVGGQAITIKVEDGKVFLNDTIEVIITDVEASNGVIHVIDAVLLPPQ